MSCCDARCGCDCADSLVIEHMWAQWDEATTPDHLLHRRDTAPTDRGVATDRPPLRLVVSDTVPCPEKAPPAGHGTNPIFLREPHRLARRIRALNSSSLGRDPEAA